jgi:hypothetical protein
MSAARFILIGALVFASAGTALAQGQPPPPPDPPPAMRKGGGTRLSGPKMDIPIFPQEPQVDDVRPWLDGKKGKKIQPKDIDPKLLKELMEKVQKMPKDEKPDQKQIEEMLEKNPQFKDPAFLEQLKKLVDNKDFPDNIEQKFPNEKLPPIDNGPDTKEKIEQVIKTAQEQPQIAPKGGDGPKIDGKMPDLPKDGIDPAGPKSAAADNEWVKWMQKNFGDSPAADGAVKDLVKAMENKGGKGMFDDVPEFKNGGWKDFDKWGKSNAGDLWKTKPPELGSTSPKMGNGGGQNWGGGGGGGGGGGSSSWGSGGGGGGGAGLGGGGTALAVIAAIAGAILLAILLFRKWKMNQAERAALIHGGQMPIDFESIRSREQLVRVFNTVSLEQIGTDARSWNHRVVADRFGATKPTVAAPADEVAGLYERARYAPDDEDLTGGEFSIARHDLRLLAGVPA